MIIGIAGPYSAPTEAEKSSNLNKLNKIAGILLERGHIPLIGLNAALPVVHTSSVSDPYKAIMDISMVVIDKCDALLLVAESPGANRERDLVLNKGLPVYYSIDEVPSAI